VRIVRRGKPVAQITAVQTPRKPVDLNALHDLTDGMRAQPESTRTAIRKMRDEDRY
jgi:antitoxin (DNA-binding transcriptional repressor) of toxin-antitoxin stability system